MIVPVVQVPALPGLGISVARTVADAVFDGLTAWVVAGAVWLVEHVAGLVTPSAASDLGAAWFLRRVDAMRTVALLMSVPLVAVATLGAVLRQDLRRLVRVYAVGVPVGILAGFAGTAAVTSALAASDRLCEAVGSAGVAAALARVGRELSTPGIPPFVDLVVAFLVVAGGLALWMELLLRATTIDIAVFFFPLGMAAMIWPATVPVARRFVEVLAALVLSKFVIVATLTLGAAALAARHGGIDAVLTGAAVLLLAAFAPFAVLRLVPLVEIAAVGHLEGVSRRPARVASGGARQVGASLRSHLGDGPPGTGNGDDGEGPATAVPVQAGEWDPDDATGLGSFPAVTPSPGAPPRSGGPLGGDAGGGAGVAAEAGPAVVPVAAVVAAAGEVYEASVAAAQGAGAGIGDLSAASEVSPPPSPSPPPLPSPSLPASPPPGGTGGSEAPWWIWPGEAAGGGGGRGPEALDGPDSTPSAGPGEG